MVLFTSLSRVQGNHMGFLVRENDWSEIYSGIHCSACRHRYIVNVNHNWRTIRELQWLMNHELSGSSDPLLSRRPLRTVRASFPAYRSSLYKPPPCGRPASLLCSCRWQLGWSRTKLLTSSLPPRDFLSKWWTFHPVSRLIGCSHKGQRDPCLFHIARILFCPWWDFFHE